MQSSLKQNEASERCSRSIDAFLQCRFLQDELTRYKEEYGELDEEVTEPDYFGGDPESAEHVAEPAEELMEDDIIIDGDEDDEEIDNEGEEDEDVEAELLSQPLLDAEGQFGYLPLIAWIYENYRCLKSPDALERALGNWITDISDTPEVRGLVADDPMPPGYHERTYGYSDPMAKRGRVELTWRGSQLVNVRAQLHFAAPLQFLGRDLAKRYYAARLDPFVRSLPDLRPADPATIVQTRIFDFAVVP